MAAAGLWTTATDLAKFGLAVQRMYRGDGGVLSRQMAHEMLTPDMKDDGLGMFITSDGKRFYHGGHNEGFLASVTAYFEGGAGIAIMTNSDNGGQLIDELMLTIAREYGWSGFSQVEKTAVHLTSADYERLTGHYKVDAGGAGEFDLVSEGRRIVMRSTEMPERELLAESADQLFFRDDFTSVEVATENGSTALKFDGWIHAVKIP
jgi:CubicO group peptidase (beta-lactamase class C family)